MEWPIIYHKGLIVENFKLFSGYTFSNKSSRSCSGVGVGWGVVMSFREYVILIYLKKQHTCYDHNYYKSIFVRKMMI